MTPRMLLLSAVLLAACGGQAAAPARTADDAKTTPTTTTSTTSTTSASTTPPRVVIAHWAFTSYHDFRGHGFSGSGRAFRRDGAKWVWAECSISHVADPEAGPNGGPKCGEWTSVADGVTPALERLEGRSTDILCAQEGALCKELGVVP